MNIEQHYCPHCGSKTNGEPFCPDCGGTQTPNKNPSEAGTPPPSNTSSRALDAAPYYKESTWNSLENGIAFAGQLSWILITLNIIFMVTREMINYSAYITLYRNSLGDLVPLEYDPQVTMSLIWMILGVIFTVILVAIFIKPFAIGCKNHDWAGLVNNVFTFGKYRVPKMLLVGLILELITEGWGGLLILIPALLIVLLGPVKTQWTVISTQN